MTECAPFYKKGRAPVNLIVAKQPHNGNGRLYPSIALALVTFSIASDRARVESSAIIAQLSSAAGVLAPRCGKHVMPLCLPMGEGHRRHIRHGAVMCPRVIFLSLPSQASHGAHPCVS